MSHSESAWIAVRPRDLTPVVEQKGNSRLTWSPSPYDVPVALRVDEDDPENPNYVVELRYLLGNERTRAERWQNVVVHAGKQTGRVYRVVVDGLNPSRASEGMSELGQLLATGPLQSAGALRNIDLVGRAIRAHAVELADQLRGSASRA